MTYETKGRLSGRHAYITGAGSGIAKATAAMFIREGAKVALAELNVDLGRAAEAEMRALGGQAFFVQTDVTNDESVKASVDAASKQLGNLDLLLNCAGGSLMEDVPVHQMDLGVWQRTMSLNLLGPFLCCRHVIPHMLLAGGGSIVNFGSWVGQMGTYKPAYAAAKGGIVAFTRSLAYEYSRNNIRANVIAPADVRTERTIKRWENKDMLLADEPNPVARRRMAMKRAYPFSSGEATDIASIAVFLASDESRMLTGTVLAADGGRSSYLRIDTD